MLPSVNQLSIGIRKHVSSTASRCLVFEKAPFRRGLIYKLAVMSPRKPNSARRTFAKIRIIINKKRVFAKIPGIGEHFLQPHNVVLVRGHGPKDSPGINYNLVRGLYDFHKLETFGRQNRRSKFGVKNLKLKMKNQISFYNNHLKNIQYRYHKVFFRSLIFRGRKI